MQIFEVRPLPPHPLPPMQGIKSAAIIDAGKSLNKTKIEKITEIERKEQQ